MRLCIFEDSRVEWLEPISLTRPAFALWCGAQPLFERHRRHFAADEVGFWVRQPLIDLWRLEQPSAPINDADWLRERPTVWINGRWLPGPEDQIAPASPHAGIVNGQVAYVVTPAGAGPDGAMVDGWLGDWCRRLPHSSAGGTMLDYLWGAVDHNGPALRHDARWFRGAPGTGRPGAKIAVEGPADDFIVAAGATVEPFVFADTRGGPVLIDEDAVVHAFTRLEGPCYVGRDSRISGAKVRAGTSIGPCCRIGGEVEASIVQGYSNKSHDGYLGHSYIGEWVNLAAGTHTSDLRNDYGAVSVTVNGRRIATGQTKVGSFIGDHTKTGLGALLNTGSMIGAFANLLPTGSLLPRCVPSFCQVQYGQLHDLSDLRSVYETAERVMRRRGKALTDAHKDYYYHLFEATLPRRHELLRASEMRRLRRSV
jgi:UDP-N-acetylglucosamine diphosphorylase/glucosamine-1-phosphate N-acetyltransferase